MQFPNFSYVARAVAAVCLLATLTLTGCGYKFTNDHPSIFGDGTATMRIKEVDNTTVFPWINQTLRSQLYDEITDRNIAIMTASESADYEMVIKISKFTITSRVLGTKRETLEYTVELEFEATVYGGEETEVVWGSGKTSISRAYPTSDARFAGTQITKLLVESIADKMRDTF